MFIADDVLASSFSRLLSIDTEGKKGLERTSALMYFLAFDALVFRQESFKSSAVDMSPDSATGLYNRSQFVSHFMNLVVIELNPISQIAELGKVSIGEPRPEKRISANFLTTPLKRASYSVEAREYPLRPSPLLLLGVEVDGGRWGIQRHPAWAQNLPSFLSDNRSKTPFTDFAILTLRGHDFRTKLRIGHAELAQAMGSMFSGELVALWFKHMLVESRRPGCPTISTQQYRSRVLIEVATADPGAAGTKKTASERARVKYLEGLLRNHGIPFN